MPRFHLPRPLRLALAVCAAALASVPSAAAVAAGGSVSLSDTVAAWTKARAWLDGYSLPREHEEEAAVVIPGAFGLSVVIRADGQIMGRGERVPVDGLSLRRAMSQAMGEAWGSGVRSLAESLGERSVGPRLTLELEVIGDPEPLLGRTFAEAAERVSPGLDGLVVRRADRWAVAFVGRQLASNSARNPQAAFAALAGQLNLPPVDLAELRKSDDVALYRVRGVRLVQLLPGGGPRPLVRNDEYVPESAVSAVSVARLAAAVGHRLVRTVPRERRDRAAEITPDLANEAMARARRLLRGDYHAASDEYRPVIAPAFEQALAAMALLRLADSSVADSVPEAPGLRAECRSTAINVLEILAADSVPALRSGPREPLGDPRVAAVAMLAVLAIPEPDRSPWLRELLQVTLETLREDASAQRQQPEGDSAAPTPAMTLALQAAALAALHRAAPATMALDDARAAADRAWEAAPGTQAVALMPWIVWAEQDLEAAGVTRAIEPLLALRDALIQVQDLSDIEAAAGGELVVPDLRGGFRLSGGGRQGASGGALPSAQSMRPIAGLAAMLKDPRLTPDVIVPPLADRQRAATRFLLQLAVREPVDRLYRRPDAVSGGIRSSTWESDQPVAAQAMAILAALETLAAMARHDALRNARDPHAEPLAVEIPTEPGGPDP